MNPQQDSEMSPDNRPTGELPLSGRVALVTGAGRGIGSAIAVGLADAGADLVIVARTEEELESTAERVRSRGRMAIPIRTDLLDHGQTDGIIRRAVAELGAVDVLVNNAGTVAPLGPSSAIRRADWDAAFSLNVSAVVTLSIAALAGMTERGWGRIVNVSSGVVGRPASMIGGNAYAATKAALEAHTVNLAAEVDGTGVTVNAYRPGGVDTAMQAYIRGRGDLAGTPLHSRFQQSYEEGQLLTPERSAASLIARIPGEETGQIWDVTDPT